MRQTEVSYTLCGHMDTVTGLEVSPDGRYLLSNAMDETGQHYWEQSALLPSSWSSQWASPQLIGIIWQDLLQSFLS